MKRIALFVITFHLFLIFNFVFFKPKEIQQDLKKLTINQYCVKPPQEQKKIATPTTATKPKPAPKPAKPVEKAPPPMKSQSPQKPVKAVTKAAPPLPPAQSPSPSPPIITQELIKKLEESIAKIEGGHDKVDTAIPLITPRAIETLHTDAPIEKSSVQENYAQTLITCLKDALNLPDFGEVTIQLTLKQDGSVAKLAVLKTESADNRRYLETHLPHVKFPVLNKPEHTFVLTFCNEV